MDYKEVKDKLYKINNSLRLDNGLYIASLGEHYRNFCWWRDIFYQSLPTLKKSPDLFIQTYHTFLDYLIKYENKIDYLTSNPHDYNNYTALHPRVYPDLKEITPNWGNMQSDSIFLMLFGIGLGLEKKLNIIRNKKDHQIIQKTIVMYEMMEYWNLAGNDCWEENCDTHSHQIGAGIAALKKLKKNGFIVNNDKLKIARGALDNLLPKETIYRDYDLAQLQLIYPLNIVNKDQREQILDNIETHLLRKNGVIRYEYDQYFNLASEHSFNAHNSLYYPSIKNQLKGNELEWTFGLAYLSIIYKKMGFELVSKNYLDNIIEKAGDDLMIPEGYYSKTNIKNQNTPLGWSVALTIIAIEELFRLK